MTDLPLTETGVRQARALHPALARREFAAVLCSPRLRATHTAELAGLTVTAIDDDLAEWFYVDYEGLTTKEDLGQQSPAGISSATDVRAASRRDPARRRPS